MHRPLAASALQTADAGTPRYVFPGVLRAKGYTLRAALGAREKRRGAATVRGFTFSSGVELEAGRARRVRTPETRAALKAVERLSLE